MNLLNRLTIKNLKLNKKRTIVTIIGILLSVALLTAVSTMYASLIQSLINFEIHERGNYHIVFQNVPSTELNTFKENRKIKSYFTTKEIGYAKIDSQNEAKPYAYILGFTEESIKNLSIRLTKGRLPENDREIIIPTHLKTNGRLSLNVGDTITLDVGKRMTSTGEILNQSNPFVSVKESGETDESDETISETKSITYKIVGIMERPATGVESYQAPGYTFATIDSNQEGLVNVYTRFNKEGIKDYCTVTAGIIGVDEQLFKKMNCDNEEFTKEEYDRYEKELEKSKYAIDANAYLITLETNPLQLSSGTGEIGIVVLIVCGIIIFTSVFCIKNSFDISITEKTKQYGMLKSIGATKKQIKKNVFYEAFILGIIGIPLGILLGLVASYILVMVCNFFLKGMLEQGLKIVLKLHWIAFIFSIILGIITIFLSALRSAQRASKISPIDSIRNSAEIKIKSKNLKSPKIIHKLFGVGGDISYKNLKRNKKKYRTTIISIIVSVSVFIALYSFMQLAFVSVKEELKLQDYNLSLSVILEEENKNDYNKVMGVTKLDNINRYTSTRVLLANIDKKYYTEKYINLNDWGAEAVEGYIDIFAVGEQSYKEYLKELGISEEKAQNKAILYNTSHIGKYDEKKQKMLYEYVETYTYNKGDQVVGTIELPEEKKIDMELEIIEIADKKPFGMSRMEDAMLIVSEETFDDLMDHQITRQIGIVFDSSNPDKLQDDLEEYLKGYTFSISNSAEEARMTNNLFILIAIFLYGFIIVISLIGITNIFNTITTNMELRKQEFAMLKSIGMTTDEFNRMIRLESIFMGLRSLIFGLPIGLALSYLIYNFLGREMGISYPIPLVAIMISIIAVFLLITSLMKYSMSKINKQNTIETIRNENI